MPITRYLNFFQTYYLINLENYLHSTGQSTSISCCIASHYDTHILLICQNRPKIKEKRCVSSVLSRNDDYRIYGFVHHSRLFFYSKTIQKSLSADNIICIQYYRNTPTVMAGGKLKVSTIEVSNICLYYLYVLNFIIIMYLSKHD